MDIKEGNVVILLLPSESAYQEISNIPPLALGVLKGYLEEKGIATYIYDLNVVLHKRRNEIPINRWDFVYDAERVIDFMHGKKDEEIENALGELVAGIDFNAYDLIGVSLGADFSWLEMHGGMMLAKWLRDKYQHPVEIGGNNVHYLLQFKSDFMQLWEGLADADIHICVGPGETMLYTMVKMIKSDGIDAEKLHLLPGAVWKEDNEIRANDQDIPSLSMPDFEGLDLDAYKMCINALETEQAKNLNEMHILKWPQPYPQIASVVNRVTLPKEAKKEILVIPYIFNYNCPFRCAFCVQSGDDKKRIVMKPTEIILDEIEALMNKYQSNYFYFYNNTFNYSRKFVVEFCEGVKKRGLKFFWTDCARFNNLDWESVKMLYESGCRKLVFGFETGSNKLLNLFDKKLDLEHAVNVMRWCKEAGIWADIEVIVGLPYELEEDFQDTVRFIETNSHLINHFALNKYFVVPDSLLGRYPQNYGIKLVRVRQRYKTLLEMARKTYIEGKTGGNVASNFQVYRYNEINGRSYKEIVEQTNDKVKRLVQVYMNLPIAEETRILEWKHSKLTNN